MSKENKKDLIQLEVGDRVADKFDEKEVLAVLIRRGWKTVYAMSHSWDGTSLWTAAELKEAGFQPIQPERQETCTEGCFDEVKGGASDEEDKACRCACQEIVRDCSCHCHHTEV